MEPRALNDAVANDLDRRVAEAATYGVDQVCSTTRWIEPAAAAFTPQALPRVFEGDCGFAAFLEHENPRGAVFTSFDCIWGFACPLLGPDPAALVEEVGRKLIPQLDFYALSISGVEPEGPLFDALTRLNLVGHTGAVDRCVADLADGFEAWLARRSSRFRRSLRTAVRTAESAGVELETEAPSTVAETDATLNRILAIEATSWKTDAESGLIDTDLGRFTADMAHRFAVAGDLRVQFATLNGHDIGYVIGGRVGTRYRGFQHSFDHRYSDLSIGKFLQFRNIEALAHEGIDTYDLGMFMDYKQSYSDRLESTITLIIAG
ncbi:MAG: GNAT family N-acetyltransferase [Actinomycetota bacterium]